MSPVSFIRCLVTTFLLLAAARGNPVITEIMADNFSFIADEDGDYSDWIEVHNPGAAPVNLTDWALTDDAANLTKWKFPAVTLQPGEFLVVWASSKNKRTPGAPLHTDFSLSKNGEYLALVQPNGTTIAQQFSPAFPAMQPNESHGSQFTMTTFVAAGATARYLIPSNGALGTTWTTPAFNASSPTNWGTGATGLGFGLLVPGITVRNVRKDGSVTNLTDVDALLALPPGSPDILEETTVIRPTVNFLDDGNAGHYAFDQVFPLGGGDNHCIKATGTIQIPTTGFWTFGISSADGGRIKIDGTQVVADNTTHGAADHWGSAFITVAGAHTFEVVMWNAAGDGEVEFYAAPGLLTSGWTSVFKLVGDTPNGGLASSTLQPGVGSNIVATNIAATMQNVSPTCYVRVPFSATGPGAMTTLQLKMRYNDGYVAYLNGANVIAQRNAPGSPVFDSAATAARPIASAAVAESVNVTAFLPQILSGSNVLAIHGLNTSAADSTFLMLPELIGGALNAGAQTVFFDSTKATPGSINGAYSLLGRVSDTQFSRKRGIFTDAFSLAITSATPDATIRYTTNGSTPTATTGTIYAAPLNISATTVIRAAAFKTGYESTDVDTQTYIFVNDVVTQSPTGAPPPGWPATSGTSQVLDYGMDPDIVNHANPTLGGVPQVKAALNALPSVCLTTDLPNLFNMSGSQGIISNPGGRGFAWERACSVEWINPPAVGFPNGTDEFQINCGVRIRGGFSRDPNNPKHGFHLYFREDYGDAKLKYPLFGRHGADEFDQLDLRTAQNYSWSFSPGDGNYNSFMREESSRQTQLDMGHHTGRLRYFHLYINGVYWGLFNTEERTEASFCATYFGGSKDNYDVIKCEQTAGYTTGFTDGNMAAWQDLWNKSKAHLNAPTNANYFKMQGLAADGVTPTADPVLLDVDNLVDFLLLNFWMGNADGAASPTANNWFGGRDRTGAHGGFKFFSHDFEHSLLSTGEDRTGPYINSNYASFTYSTPMFLHQDMMANTEFKMRWADRVQKHMFNGGQLTPAAWAQRLNKLAVIVDSAILAESARWGDSKIAVPFNRNNWLNARNFILGTVVPARHPIVLAQLRGDGLYPPIDAPTITPFGGYVSAGSEAVMTTPTGTMYHMPDGSDPRAVGGGIRPGALVYSSGTTSVSLIAAGASWKYLGDGSDQGTAWRGVGFNDAAWPSGNAELGYGDGDEATTLPTVDVDGMTAGVQRNATSYFRKTFTVTDASNITGANISLKYDDQAWVYLDGTLILKTNAGLTDSPAFNFYTAVDTPNEAIFFDFPINPALLTPGAHTLAVEVHQGDRGSSDVSFNLAFTATRTTSSTPLTLTGSGVRPLKVRARDGTTWSALVDATFLVNTEAATAANLVISEIMYHPADPSPAEVAAGFGDADDFEYIEFVNIGSLNVDLEGLFLYGPISFDFKDSLVGRTLAPGGRVLLVSRKSAFEFRYGSGKPVAGSYSGHLNNAGEQIVLYNPAETAMSNVTYSPAGGWPTSADGQGYSLVRINPDGILANDNNPARWRRSTAIGGNPGVGDAMSFPAWKTENSVTTNTGDGDGDGLTNTQEYLLGGGVAVSDTARLPRLGMSAGYPTLTFTRRFATDDATFVVETAPAVTGPWTPDGVLLSTTANPDGTETLVYRAPNPQTLNGPRFYLRLKGQIVP